MNLPGGEIVIWSAASTDDYQPRTRPGSTKTETWDPATNKRTQFTLESTRHDMFCPGTAVLDNEVMITGGKNNKQTTFYNFKTDDWSKGEKMNIGRGYHSMTVLANGDVFTLGGSWSGDATKGNRIGELWSADSKTWKILDDVDDDPMLTDDIAGVYRSDNHMWLFVAPNSKIFHAGPSTSMNWITVSGKGSVEGAGKRDGKDAMNGNAVMYDVGKILVAGGSPDYHTADGSSNAYVIDINGNNPKITKTGSMSTERTFANSVLLPTGEVVVIGGMSYGILFNDDGFIRKAEIWSPETGKWTSLAQMEIPRTYHSVAILLKDGRLMAAGGGLCGGCGVNHADMEVFNPPYLFDNKGKPADRPVIVSAPDSTEAGKEFTVTMDSSGAHTFALVRLNAVTHSLNNDARRIPLSSNRRSKKFTLSVPSNKNVALVGKYFLFAMNEDGVPSVGVDISISL